MVPEGFEDVEFGTFDECNASPQLPTGVLGLVLNTPRSVKVAPSSPWPVCGTYRVTGSFLNRFTSMSNEIVIVVVAARTHVPYARNLVRDDLRPEPQRFDESEVGWETIQVEGWFNLDLFAWLGQLPREPGRYYVFATVGELTSNVCTVELVTP